MCAHFIMIPKEELERIIADIHNDLKTEQRAQPAAAYPGTHPGTYPAAWPKSKVPVVVPQASRLEIKTMQWGYPVSWQKAVVYNTRMETALAPKPSIWSDSVRNRRCLVPSLGFYEPHMTDSHPSPRTGKPVKDQYRFRLPDSDIVWMAGVFEDEHFSIMTTAPNQWMAKIHPRMPVVLLPDELDVWLHGAYATLADRTQIRLESIKEAS